MEQKWSQKGKKDRKLAEMVLKWSKNHIFSWLEMAFFTQRKKKLIWIYETCYNWQIFFVSSSFFCRAIEFFVCVSIVYFPSWQFGHSNLGLRVQLLMKKLHLNLVKLHVANDKLMTSLLDLWEILSLTRHRQIASFSKQI